MKGHFMRGHAVAALALGALVIPATASASGEKPMEEVPKRAEPGELDRHDCADERLRRKVRCGRSPRLVLRE